MSLTLTRLQALRRQSGAPATAAVATPAPTPTKIDSDPLARLRGLLRVKRRDAPAPASPADRTLPGREIAPGLWLQEARLPFDLPWQPHLDAAFARRDRGDWRQRLNARGILFEIVAPVADVPNDPQALENDILVPFADSDLKTVNSPFWISGETKVQPRMAPDLG